MTTVMKLFSLLLCLELIVGPVRGSIILSSSALAQSCPAGQAFSNDLGRCVLSEQSINTNTQVDSCRGTTDEAARKECYASNASARFEDERRDKLAGCESLSDDKAKKECRRKYGDKDDCEGLEGDAKKECKKKNRGRSDAFMNLDEGGKTNAAGYISSAATVAVPLFFIIKAMSDGNGPKKCKPASLVLLYAGGASLLIGEVVSYFKHKKNLNEMEEARNALTVSEGTGNADDNKAVATEAQSQSFELLAQNEDSIAEVAKTKKITYGIATGLFGAGAIMATVETFQLKKARAERTAAYPRLSVPATAAEAQATITRTEATIRRLTCGMDAASGKDPNASGSGGTAGAGSTSGNGSGGSTTTGGSNKLNVNTVITGASTVLPMVMNQSGKSDDATTSNDTHTDLPGTEDNTTNQPTNTDEEVNFCNGTSQATCEAGCTWDPMTKECTSASINLNDILNRGIKTKAAKNIQHARSYQEMMELLAEIDSLEYENYSRGSYYDGNPLMESLDETSFSQVVSKVVSESFLSNSYAQGTEKVVELDEVVVTAKRTNPQYLTPKKATLIPNDLGEPELMIRTTPGVNANQVPQAKSEVKGIFNKAVYTPAGRLITNGLLGTWMGIMTSHMSKQQKISEARAELLRGIKTDFDSQSGINLCTSADRNNPGKPRCYCFTSDNQQNPARSKSKICNTQLAKLKYDVNGLAASPKVCVDQNFGVDASCSCRNRKGADGKNTCMKVSSNFNISGLNPGTFKMISAAAGPANDLTNGNASVGDMDSGAIGANAARIKKVADDSLAKDKAASKAAKNLEKALLKATNGISMGGSGFAQKPMGRLSPKEASAELAKELAKKDEIEVTTAGATGASAPADIPAEEMPEFGMTEDMVNAQETEIAEVMGQDLDMAGSDINTGSTTNIFEVLSNRYQRSGMRRLFDEKGETKADAPAKSEIAP